MTMNIIDTKELPDSDGFTIQAHLVPDEEIKPTDFDCYDAAQIDAWKHDLWGYVGVIVTASRNGIEFGSASMWGYEYGDLPGVDEWCNPLDDARNYEDLVAEAVADARTTLTEINAVDKAAS